MLSRNRAVVSACVMSCLALCSHSLAQSAGPLPSPHPNSEADFTLQQLHGDDASFNSAFERIHLMTEAGVAVNPKWLAILMEKGKYADIESLALRGILNTPDNAGIVADMEKSRTLALLEEGKFDEALVAAKASYNVIPLRGTEAAVKLLGRCFDEKYPDDPSILKKFKTQQVEWSSATTMPAATSDLGENVLRAIKLPAEPFQAAMATYTKRDCVTLLSKGNLLLLMDHCAEARKAFESAELAAEKPAETTAAVEGIARAIRADAGALGPANAYIVAQQKGQ